VSKKRAGTEGEENGLGKKKIPCKENGEDRGTEQGGTSRRIPTEKEQREGGFVERDGFFSDRSLHLKDGGINVRRSGC